MKTTAYSRRLRNTHLHGEQQKNQESFFSQSPTCQRQPFFSHSPTHGPVVQAKLTIGKVNDPYEQEADRVANKVVAQSGQSPQVQQQEPGAVQRAALMSSVEDEKPGTAEARMEKDKLIQEKIQKMDEQEEEVQTKQEDEEVQAKQEDEEVQAKQESGSTASSTTSQNIKKSAGRGQPFSGQVRTEMEQAFGADFSVVNIHTDQHAVQLNQQLRSQAFTHGKDIFFNAGKYRPETSAGKRLLAHELTHVIQQCGREKLSNDSK